MGTTDEFQGHDPSVPVPTPIALSELTDLQGRERNEPRSKRPRLDET